MRYLFQGDSITDAGRGDHEDPFSMGSGFPCLLEAELTYEQTDCEVLNCGIGGNRIVDLLARWKKDCLNLRPDVLTILIGVNDVWHEFDDANGVKKEIFEQVYRILLQEALETLPGIRIILMGAYVLHGPSTDPNWDVFSSEVKVRRDITRKLASEYQLEYVDLQEVFDEAQSKAPTSHWSADGVHPTAAGHKLIAEAWKEVVGKNKA